ncbi:MAG: hypothetical protein AAF545_00510 [Pseudomonadota bacterium]
MPRAILAVFLASLVIALPFGMFWMIALPVTFVAGLLFGLPLLFLLRTFNWVSWWHVVLAGVVTSLPYIGFYLRLNTGHTEHVGLYNSVYAVAMGMLGGLIVWVVGVFRNPTFSAADTPFPKSVVLAPLLIATVFNYRGKLAPEYVHGCITDFKSVENPTPWNHAVVTVVTDDGETYKDGITIGHSDPAIVGNCAWGSKKRTATLSRYYYTLHSTQSNQCVRQCPNQK